MKVTVLAGTQINDSGTLHPAGDTFTPVSDQTVVDVWVQSGWAQLVPNKTPDSADADSAISSDTTGPVDVTTAIPAKRTRRKTA